MATKLAEWLSERRFLQGIDRFEQLIAKVLSLLLVVLILLASFELLKQLAISLIAGQALSQDDALISYFGKLLNILIALELLQNLTAYLQRHAVQIQLVLLTAITAVARKLIVLPGADASKPQLVVALGICVVCLAGAYWLIRSISPVGPRPRTAPARSFLEPDPSPPPDGDDQG
ncbi:MAG: phosphate-starvation-inducible PsiE family protein [Cyanobacteriota bacterium]|nr:phosphate-starvation-inducible PsiE family protein [Cyanobacteriota bacterium]